MVFIYRQRVYLPAIIACANLEALSQWKKFSENFITVFSLLYYLSNLFQISFLIQKLPVEKKMVLRDFYQFNQGPIFFYKIKQKWRIFIDENQKTVIIHKKAAL